MAILVVIFAPKGMVGLWRDWLARIGRTFERSAADATKLRTDP